ncbi:ArsA family ATPase [Demequina pelophila]|uniref:ArsA family ATPase n=1 Tax=Demequina pelophila TaxID=1638984 RepID=UPI000783230F|nr:ArsA family ATPase [Demequina pelophila]
MLLDLARERRVIVVGGKGGVGKTAVSSALALARAREGARVLLVSSDPAHNLGHLWLADIGDRGAQIEAGLTAIEIDPAATTERHLSRVGATLRRMMPEHLHGQVERHLDLVRQAPGTHESAILERLTEVVLDDAYDLVVLDTAPSGHTTRLLSLPETMTAWTDALLERRDASARLGAAAQALDPAAALARESGRAGRSEPDPQDGRAARDRELRDLLVARASRLARLRDRLTDARHTSFVAVLAAERLPVLETIELAEQLSATGVDLAALVVNRRSPADAGDLLAAKRASEEAHLGTLRERLPGLPVTQVPLLGGDVVGAEGLERIGRHLGAGV